MNDGAALEADAGGKCEKSESEQSNLTGLPGRLGASLASSRPSGDHSFIQDEPKK